MLGSCSLAQLATLLATFLAITWISSHRAEAANGLGLQPTLHTSTIFNDNFVDTKQYIPRIVHQSYLPDEVTLDKLSTSPRSHFRRDWRRSCQIHNPEFEYMFWDESMAQDFISQHYPDMLPYYNHVSRIVLKSDILRIMILDKLGGVWMDIDTECFAPLEPVLRGFHLVAQAEWTFQLCNSHMAGVPGHPVWRQLMEWFKQKVEANVTNPLEHTGPVALTTLVKAHIQPANPDRNMSLIAGSWTDPVYPSKFRAYGYQEAWFLPCKWKSAYMSPCQSDLARTKAIVRQLSNGVNVALTYAQQPDAPQSVKDMVNIAMQFAKVRGSHEYANSWTKWRFSDGMKMITRAQEALHGLLPFFSTPPVFEEYPGWVSGGCGQEEVDQQALSQFQLCGAVLRAAAAEGACNILSIRGRREQQMFPNSTLPLDLEEFAALNYNCTVKVLTLQPKKQEQVLAEGLVMVAPEPMQLGPVYDHLSLPPTLTLEYVFKNMVEHANLTLLHIDCAGSCRLWEVLNTLPLQGSLLLKRVGSLLLDLGGLPLRSRHILNTVYQHLYQEIGMVGYSWGPSHRSLPASSVTASTAAVSGTYDTVQGSNPLTKNEVQGQSQTLQGRVEPGTFRRPDGRMDMPAPKLGFARVL